MAQDTRNALDPLAALAEPVRRRLYEYVADQSAPVDRDQAATGTGVGRPLAAFHLDRLADAGLLDVEFRRRSGRTGPGAGRPAKFYRRPVDREISVSLPHRQYDLAARVFAEGIDREPAVPAAVLDAAHREGVRLAGDPAPADRDALLGLLGECGYKPAVEPDGVVRLRNCPFHALVEDHRQLTCSMNRSLLEGAASRATGSGLAPVAAPADGYCCVVLVPTDHGDGAPTTSKEAAR
jgi:predicted ArsR family transcriptional regulator